MKYREVKTYYFDQEKSGNNKEDDLINILNIPFVVRHIECINIDIKVYALNI